MEEGAWYHMKFSIIIPVYNGAKYLDRAMKSVLSQPQNRAVDIEVLLIENGSTDDSGKMCDEYAANYQMVTTLHRGKIGAYAARRLGMEVASGDWLLFLDADDFIEGNMLEQMVAQAQQSDSDVVICGYYLFDNTLKEKIKNISIPEKALKRSPFAPKDLRANLFTLCGRQV